jgi:hypothetical protein
MADTNDTNAIIKELQAKPKIPIKGNTSYFLKKFSKQQTKRLIQILKKK